MSAYLVMKLELVRGIPRFRGAHIFSSPANSLTRHTSTEIFVDIEEMAGANYQEAYDKMKSYIEKSSHLEWVRPFVDGGFDELAEEIERENNPLNVVLDNMGELP